MKQIIEFEAVRAQRLSSALETLSARSARYGYLVGLLQDAKRCVELNMKADTDNDSGDESILAQVCDSITDGVSALSAIMSSAIQQAGIPAK